MYYLPTLQTPRIANKAFYPTTMLPKVVKFKGYQLFLAIYFHTNLGSYLMYLLT
jgi:hypothetical protein